jgi:iron complex transport system ATP-binding protein
MTKMKVPVFEVNDLRVEREAVILHDLSWRVERGQHWAVLGANGSGKTSLLSAVTGYLIPTRGTIRIGADTFGTTDWREVRQAVGLVSSSLGHHIEPAQTAGDVVLSGRDAQINFWGRVGPKEAAQARRILRRVRALHLINRPWRVLSQGERQRVLIGRALMARLRILFLDEPAAGLDPVAREDFLHFLSELAKHPHAPTLVLVTHHVEEIMPVFSHVLILKDARVMAQGPKKRALTSAALTAAFGVPARLRQRRGRYTLELRRSTGWRISTCNPESIRGKRRRGEKDRA